MKAPPKPVQGFRLLLYFLVLAVSHIGLTAHAQEGDHNHECLGGKGHDPATEIPAGQQRGPVPLNTVVKPTVVSRTGWGCPDGQSSPLWPSQYTTVTHLIVHHSDTPNSESSWPARVRQIFDFHRNDPTRLWGDIGYNYLIDPNGVIYEGRAGGDNVIGAHFCSKNGGTMGVCMLGTFSSVSPTQAALNSLHQLLAWKCSQRGLDPLGSAFHTNTGLTLQVICGHQNGCSTSCPGTQTQSLLPSIRQAVNAIIDGGGEDSTPPTIANFSVSPTNISLGGSFTMSFRASDSGGSGLDFAQVWWTTDNGGSPDASNWAQYGANQSLASSGDGPVDKSYSITPPGGVYWFGLHLDDQDGNSSTESDWGFSPQRVTVSGTGTNSLVYQTSVIHDGTGGGLGNDNGQINAGEEIDLDVYLRNTGSTTITGISATLSTSSSYVTIADANENWPDIVAGESQPCNSDFDFEVSASAPGGHIINFTLSISSDQGSWTSSFSLQVVGGGGGGQVSLEYFSHQIDDDTNTSNGNDDGIVNPGETIELPVTLRNTGTGTANNVEAVLTTSSPYITITDDDRTWGDIAGGTTDESSDFDFDFVVDGSCPDGHVIQFFLAITSDEGSWSDSFSITVVGGPAGEPNFTYAGSVVHDGTGGGRGNNNGAIDAGEEIDLDVSVTNNGSAAATNVVATISTSDPYVVINDASENFPDLGISSTGTTNGDFDFSILQTCPIGRTIHFDLEVSSDQGATTTTFAVQVAGALPPPEPLRITSFSVVPGSLSVTFPSSVERPYTLWRSHNLTNWSPLGTFSGKAISTSITVGGGIGTEPKEFYKVSQD